MIIKEKAAFPPYSYIDPHGKPEGLNVDLVRAIMEDLDIPYVLELDSWKNIKAGLSEGDVMATSMLYSIDRDSVYAFSSSYLQIRINAVYRKGSVPISSLNDLKNKIVAVEDKSITQDIIHAAGCDANAVTTTNLENALLDLAQGQYNAVICDINTAKFIIKKHHLANLMTSELGLPPRYYCFVGMDTKTTEMLEKGLTDLRKNGELDKLTNKWIPANTGRETSSLALYIIGILLLAVAFSVLSIELHKNRLRKSDEATLRHEKAATDNTEHSQAMGALLHKFETVFTNANIGLVYYDSNMILVDLNKKAADFLSVKDKNEWIGKSSLKDDIYLAQYAMTEHPEPHVDIINIDYDNNPFLKKAIMEGLTAPTDKSGIHYYEMYFNPVYTDNDSLDCIILSINDVTDLIEAQKALEADKSKAEDADRQKSAFLANMSHDVRTPLNAILGFTNLALDTDDPKEKEEYIKIINVNGELLMHLVNDILDISKIEAGTLDYTPKTIDFSIEFDELSKSLQRTSMNPEVEFIVDNPYPSCKVEIDPARCAQILTNFTTNAIKHTEKGHIKAGYSYVDGGIRIYVEDTGSGIPESIHDKIFQRFVKLDEIQGTGLGLAICKAITDRCEGKIGFDSKEGQGSTFWAWIPAQKA
jgi:ABC-type amino acid transport substrate-binding protein/nitrogen-specific signal transduction histidine kinase